MSKYNFQLAGCLRIAANVLRLGEVAEYGKINYQF